MSTVPMRVRASNVRSRPAVAAPPTSIVAPPESRTSRSAAIASVLIAPAAATVTLRPASPMIVPPE